MSIPESIDYGIVKKPLRSRLLDLMSDLDWHDWSKLRSVAGARYSARLHELRMEGYQIECKTIGDGSCGKKYKLLSLERQTPPQKRVKAFLDPKAVVMLLESGIVRESLKIALRDAYASYAANADKL